MAALGEDLGRVALNCNHSLSVTSCQLPSVPKSTKLSVLSKTLRNMVLPVSTALASTMSPPTAHAHQTYYAPEQRRAAEQFGQPGCPQADEEWSSDEEWDSDDEHHPVLEFPTLSATLAGAKLLTNEVHVIEFVRNEIE